MKNGQCPKCNSSNVFKMQNGIYWGNGYLRFVGSRPLMNTNCDSYVCIDCGYFENYIVDREILQKVPNMKKGWTKVA